MENDNRLVDFGLIDFEFLINDLGILRSFLCYRVKSVLIIFSTKFEISFLPVYMK